MGAEIQSRLPAPVLLRAQAAGDAGDRWLASLGACIAHLESAWGVRVGEILTGGSEALVAEARMADGADAIVKISLPDAADITREADVLEFAAGRGYARLLARDDSRRALLLERLGPTLRTRIDDVETQIRVLCETLEEAWLPLDSARGLTTGAEKAEWLAAFIGERWKLLARPCDVDTVKKALQFAGERAAAHSAEGSVLVHGDAHSGNALLVPGAFEEHALRCKFIDPDGLFAEKACDLAAPMRDWSGELLAGATARLARERCELLARLTGIDDRAIWQWGFVERVSTGLALLGIGMKDEGSEMLAVADRIRDG